MTDLLVVGAGPAGRALAHRACAAGLAVTVVDPAPDREWTATFGLFGDDLPHWIDRRVITASSPSFTVYTPQRRDLDREYCTVSAARLQQVLDLDAATVVRACVTTLTARSVSLDDGRILSARTVIDARGGQAHADDRHPRQTAYGVFRTIPVQSDPHVGEPSMVLMDWRRTPEHAPSFVYRVDLGEGTELVEETCLAGRPAPTPAVLGDRSARTTIRPPELVDFPLLSSPTPWKRDRDAPVRFGAAGGLMNPATGYSLGASLAAVDGLVDALRSGTDPARVLWTRGARWTYRLRVIGLGVLLGLDGPQLTAFFDAFFDLPVASQCAYLNSRDDFAGTLSTMWKVFRRLPIRLQVRVMRLTLNSTPESDPGPPPQRWPCRCPGPSPDRSANRGPAAATRRPR